MDHPRREWRNSWFGRAVGSGFGLGMFCIVLFVDGPDDRARISWDQLLISLCILLMGAAVIAAVWTSRLELVEGVLTAVNFGRSSSVSIAHVESVEPSSWPCTGLLIVTTSGQRVRTLISGSVGNELWRTRADRICEEIEQIAETGR